MKKILAVFLVLVVGTLLYQHCWEPEPVRPVSPELREVSDSMVVSIARMQRLLSDSITLIDRTKERDALQAKAVGSADSLRAKRLSLRPAHQTGTLPVGQPADTARLLTELATVREERDLAIQESDSLRVALRYSDSTKAELLAGFRQVQLAAAEFLSAQIRAEGRLNQLIPKVEKLELENAKLRRGCRIFGVPCPQVGLGVALTSTGELRPAVALMIPVKL